MNKSESIKNFAAAMANFQGEVKNPPKSADNPFYKSKYTTLDVLIDTAKPLLEKNGLSYIQSCSGDGSNITVTTLLMHSSGEWIESDPLVLKADKATAQGAGSAITYARRYALAAVLGLASDEDDDGNNAEKQTTKNADLSSKKSIKGKDTTTTQKPAKKKNTEELATKEQVFEILELAKQKKADIPGYDFKNDIENLAKNGQISKAAPFGDKEGTIINWTVEDYKEIKAQLEVPF